jgi:hypothetical protein
MFGLFVSGEFKGFWSNSVGDIFFDATCINMQWDKSLTSMVYYPSLKDSELQHAVASLSDVKVYEKHQEQNGVDENDQPIIEEVATLIKTIQADTFVTNGITIIPC